MVKGRRDQVVLASKFGIKANWKARLLGPVKPAVRLIKGMRSRPDGKASAPAHTPWSGADRFHDRISLDAREMRKSLEETLGALGTDYLDYFFIHEPTASLSHLDELSEAALRLKQEGKIRAFGLAYNRLQQDLHAPYLSRFDLLQFDNSPGAAGYEATTRERAGKANIFFSPLRGGRSDLSPAEKLVTLNRDYPRSVILCSMFKEEHIRMNARLFY